jgi:hypothetical protein
MSMRQSKMRMDRGAWIAEFVLSFFLAFPEAHGQAALERAVDKFVANVTGGDLGSHDHPMARWREPICPVVAGLSRAEGQMLFDRFVDVLASVDARVDASGCRANLFIVVTAHPEADLRSWRRRDVHVFGDLRGTDEFIGTPRPVRIWYNASLVDADGRAASTFGGTLRGIPSYRIDAVPHREFDVVPELSSVIAVVDSRRMAGLDWRQVADYIAMAGLTDMKLDADVGDVPSILRLFTAAAGARPLRLTAWDRAFIKELYLADPVDRHQRLEMAKRMYHDLAR